jgi:hypothetical protein
MNSFKGMNHKIYKQTLLDLDIEQVSQTESISHNHKFLHGLLDPHDTFSALIRRSLRISRGSHSLYLL